MTAEEAAAYIIPDNTSLVVLDEDGDAVLLGSLVAADALYTGTDPRWCPASVGSSPSSHTVANGCTAGFSSLTALMADLRATYGQYYATLPNGTIWIESGTYTAATEGVDPVTGSIFINGFDPTLATDSNGNWSNPHNDAYADLTIQGGWNTVTGAIDNNSTFEIPITIFWGGNLTINNLSFTKTGGIATLNPNTTDTVNYDQDLDGFGPDTANPANDYSGYGSTIPDPIVGGNYGSYTLQAVVHDDRDIVTGDGHVRTLTINNVTVSNSTGNGARFTADGAVNMTGAVNTFSNNSGNGLVVDTVWAPISLNNVTASYNTSNGAVLRSQYGSISVGGNNKFENNTANGVSATTDSRNICTGYWVGATYYQYTSSGDCVDGGWTTYKADISLNNVTASSNGMSGGYFQTGGYGIYTQFGAGVDFHTPWRYGDYRADDVYGGFDFYNQPASGSGNDHWDGDQVTTGRGSITLTGTNIFNSNHGDQGLFAQTWEGNISMSNVSASSNTNDGANLRAGDVMRDGNEGGSGNITLSGANHFDNNQNGDGLNAWAFAGNVNLNNTSANGNKINGATLETGGYGYWDANAYNVWVVNYSGRTSTAGSYYEDPATGWWYYDNPGVTPDDVYNQVGGWVTGGGDINITGTATAANSFSSNSTGYGLNAYVGGLWNPSNISGNYITADGNGLYGANLLAPQYTAVNNPVNTDQIDDTVPTAPHDGLDGVAETAKWAPGATAAGNVSVQGVNSFTLNGIVGNTAGGSYGLNIWADGDVDLNSVTADKNGEYGGYLYSDHLSIDLTGTNSLTGNGLWGHADGYGLWAMSPTAYQHTYVWNVSANDNNYYGAMLHATGTGGDVGIFGARNNFTVNDSWGLHVFARDRLDADNITADSNGSLVANYGADLNAAYIYGAGASYFRYNTTYGLTANATQSISLTQVVADYNTSYGAWLGADNGSVSVDGGTNSSFSHNGVDNGKGADPDAYGLNVTAYANITLSNVLTADHNATYGASLNGAVGDGSGFIKVSGSGFKYNGTSGLYAGTDGDVTLSATDASFNGTYGASLISSAGNVNVGCIFEGNMGGSGLTVQAYKDIALNNTQAIKNSENGAELYSTTGNISVMSSTFNENTYNGLLASTQAAGATTYVYKSFGVGNTGGNGFLFNGVPSADITIECSEFTSDLTPDINIANAGGSTTLLGVTYGTSVITGALFTPAHSCNPVVPPVEPEGDKPVVPPVEPEGDKPVVVVPQGAAGQVVMTYEPRIGDGSEIPFSCDRYLGLELTTDPKTDFVRLPCGLGDKASAATLLEGDLPEALSERAFVSALTYSIYDIQPSTEQVLVSFKLPDGETGDAYQIKFWDAESAKWVVVENTFFENGYLQAWVDASVTGTYVLVKK